MRFRLPPSSVPIWHPFSLSVFYDKPAEQGGAPPPSEGTPPEATPAETSYVPEDLQSLDGKEITKRERDLRSKYEKARGVRPPTAESLAEAARCADAIEALTGEHTRRAEEASEREKQLAELDARIRVPDAPAAGTGDDKEPADATPPAAPAPVPDATPPAAPAPTAPSVRAVAAAGAPTPAVPTPGQAAAAVPARPEQRPNVSPPSPVVTIIAAGDVPGFSAGSEIPGADKLGEAMAGKIWSIIRQGTAAGHAPLGRFEVARFNAEWPPERTLAAGAEEANTLVIENVVSPKAIAAAGGICAPVAANYELEVIATAVQPVGDALPSFGAQGQAHGGIRYIRPPRLSDLAGSTTVWTEVNDTTPGAANQGPGFVGVGPATKPIITITCGDIEEVLVDAVVTRLRVGNFNRRFFPEQFEAWWQLAKAEAARVAETYRLDRFDQISAGPGGRNLTAIHRLGVMRDLLEAHNRLGCSFRERNRMDESAQLQIFIPSWVKRAMQADLALEQPGAPEDRLATTAAQVASYYSNLNLSVTWMREASTAVGLPFHTAPGEADMEAINKAAAALEGWPVDAVCYVTHPGAVGALDGGTLDLGLEIRDSSLNALNNVEAFIEVFIGVFFRGLEFDRLDSTVCVNGQASAAELLTDCYGS